MRDYWDFSCHCPTCKKGRARKQSDDKKRVELGKIHARLEQNVVGDTLEECRKLLEERERAVKMQEELGFRGHFQPEL